MKRFTRWLPLLAGGSCLFIGGCLENTLSWVAPFIL